MEKYLKFLEEYCKQNPPIHRDLESVLVVLHGYYVENNPIDYKKIRDISASCGPNFQISACKKLIPSSILSATPVPSMSA